MVHYAIVHNLRCFCAATLYGGAVVCCLANASAAEPSESAGGGSWHEKTAVDAEPAGESWIGLDGYRRVAALYSGVTWSPIGNLRQDGFRVRAVAGGSIYRYSGQQFDQSSQTPVYNSYLGTGQFLDLLAGWQMSQGGTTIKAFGGYGRISNVTAPLDPEARIAGMARGGKGVLEIWQNWSPAAWTSLDLSAARANTTYSAVLRTGWRIEPDPTSSWSLGPELSQIGNTSSTLRRLGLFVRHETLANEFTVSGGVSRASNDSPMGYLTGQYLRRF